MILLEKSFHSYIVNELGDIRNSKMKLMKPFEDKDGYLRIALMVNGKQKKFHIHRLVYSLFVGELKKPYVCCHIDGNIKNNHYTNIKQATQKENIRDKLMHGTWQAGNKHPACLYSDTEVTKVQKLLDINSSLSNKQIADLVNLPQHFVLDVRRGKRQTFQQRIENQKAKYEIYWN